MALLLRFDPYGKTGFAICRICKSSVHQSGSHYCQGCAYKKGTGAVTLWAAVFNRKNAAVSGRNMISPSFHFKPPGLSRSFDVLETFQHCVFQESAPCVGRRFWTPRTTNRPLCSGGHKDDWRHVQCGLLCEMGQELHGYHLICVSDLTACFKCIIISSYICSICDIWSDLFFECNKVFVRIISAETIKL